MTQISSEPGTNEVHNAGLESEAVEKVGDAFLVVRAPASDEGAHSFFSGRDVRTTFFNSLGYQPALSSIWTGTIPAFQSALESVVRSAIFKSNCFLCQKRVEKGIYGGTL